MDFSKLILHEGTSLYSMKEWKYRTVSVCGYFYGYGYRFFVVRDPYRPCKFTVIEEKTGRRLCKDFFCRSIGVAFDRAKEVIEENKDRLEFKVTVATGLAQRVLSFQPVSAAILYTIWK